MTQLTSPVSNLIRIEILKLTCNKKNLLSLDIFCFNKIKISLLIKKKFLITAKINEERYFF